MKQILLLFLTLATISNAMEREKKRPHEDEHVSSNPKGRPFDFHSHYRVISPKKKIVLSDSFIHDICHNDRKTILKLFDKQKVAFEQRLEFYTGAALAFFCKNAKLSTREKTAFLTQMKHDAEHMKYKFMRKNAGKQNPEVQKAQNITINEWRTQFQQKQLERLRNALDLIPDEDKSKITITTAIISHLHSLANMQQANETLGLEAPMVVPHNLYLGYACEQAEKNPNRDVFNFLKAQDIAANSVAYQNWLEQTITRRNI